MREEHEFFGSGLRIGKKTLGEQPAELTPVYVLFIQAVQILVGDEDNFGIFERFDEIPTSFLRNKTSKRNNELIFRKEKEVLFFFCFRIAVIDAENSFDYQAEVIANHALHVEEIAFCNFA